MNHSISCGAEPAFPVLNSTVDGYTITCSDLTVPFFTPINSGLSELPWSDVTLLIGALLVSCALATGINTLTYMFIRK